MAEITNADAIKAWSRASQEIVANFGDEGDFTRRYLLNPVIQEGCTLQKVIEPQLDEAIARQYQAERYWHVPGYLVIYAAKSS